MGPRPFSRGNPCLLSFQTSALRGLQWGRDLSVAETWIASMRSGRTDRSFNGAATFQSRKRAFHRARTGLCMLLQWGRDLSVAETCFSSCTDGAVYAASMGPRPFSRGNESSGRRLRSSRSCFNGAATFQSRKLVGVGMACDSTWALQWGRDLSVAETTSRSWT